MQLGVFCVQRIVGQGLAEILKVTVQINVLVCHAPLKREAVRVEPMDIQHGHASRFGLGTPLIVMQGKHLHAAAAVAFYAVAGAANDQQLLSIRRAV